MINSRIHFSKRALAGVVLCVCIRVYAADSDYLNMELDQLLQVPNRGRELSVIFDFPL